MMRFKRFIIESTEEKEAKLRHLEHPEDHFLNVGEIGYHHAVNTLVSTHNHLTGNKEGLKRLSLKVDGAPSIVAGIHPETKRFFVASKSAFNKTPKINYTDADIDANHGKVPGLANKLKLALKHLPKVIHSGIHQGDLIHDDTIKNAGKDSISFKPNTVTHTIPTKSDEAKKIKSSKIGMAFHTSYSGKTFDSLKADYGKKPDFSDHKDVHLMDVSHDSSQANYTGHHQKVFMLNIKRAEEFHKTKPYNAIAPHGELLKQYVNHAIKTDEKKTSDGYRKFLGDKKGLPNAFNLQQHLDDNKEHFDNALKMHGHLEDAKNALVHSLGKTHGDYTFSTNGKESKPEGFVAVTKDGRPSKLVHRGEFSKNNFLSGSFQKKK